MKLQNTNETNGQDIDRTKWKNLKHLSFKRRLWRWLKYNAFGIPEGGAVSGFAFFVMCVLDWR